MLHESINQIEEITDWKRAEDRILRQEEQSDRKLDPKIQNQFTSTFNQLISTSA